MVRDKVGSFKSRDEMERWLNNWIGNYVDGDPANSSEDTKARRPLAAAEVVVEEVEGAPGYYNPVFPEAALSVGGPVRVASSGLETAVREGLKPSAAVLSPYRKEPRPDAGRPPLRDLASRH